MKIPILSFLFAILSFTLNAQVTELQKIGQTPGGAGFHVNYDSTSQRLFVGCGTSIWVYDASDTGNIHLVAKRPLLGLVNETNLYGNILFVAATHDGLWALDVNSDTLTPIAHYETKGDSAAYDIERSHDTLFLANGKKVQILKFDAVNGFTKISQFGIANATGVTRRDDLIAVCSRVLLNGTVAVYDISNLSVPIASWTNSTIYTAYDVQFADLRDDIIYVCGGSNNFGTTGQFYALQLSGNTLNPVDHYTINGVYGFAMAYIINMDSRNDTLFLATTAGLNGTVTDVPVLDASDLPSDSMEVIGHIRPGLWHFDVSLMRGTPFLAMSSEWLGVLISNVSQLAPEDTLCFLPTGGWGIRSYLYGDTLWVCNEGYGLVAYKTNDLLYSAGFVQNPAIFHIFTQFVSDFAFINDTLIILNTTEIFNIKPWFSGGQPVKIADINNDGWSAVKMIYTDKGPRIVAGEGVALTLKLYDPFDSSNNYPLLSSVSIANDPFGLTISGDTVWCGAKINGIFSLAAFKIAGDSFSFITSIPTPGEAIRISKKENLIAVGCSNSGFAWYRYSNGVLTEYNRFTGWANDCSGVFLKNNYLYVANKLKGLEVYDIANPDTALLVATSRGSGGWEGRYGSTGVIVGDDGTIFLLDYQGSAFIIEPYDTSLSSAPQYQPVIDNKNIFIYPNPADNYITVKFSNEMKFSNPSIKMINAVGEKVVNTPLPLSSEIKVDTHNLPAGIYFICITDNYKLIAVRKIIIE